MREKGSIRPRGEDTFEVSLYAGKCPVTGKRRYIRQTVKGTVRDAISARTKLQTEKILYSKLTGGHAVDSLIAVTLGISGSPHSISVDVLALALATLGKLTLGELRLLDLTAFFCLAIAMGHSPQEIKDLEEILKVGCKRSAVWGVQFPLQEELAHHSTRLTDPAAVLKTAMRTLTQLLPLREDYTPMNLKPISLRQRTDIPPDYLDLDQLPTRRDLIALAVGDYVQVATEQVPSERFWGRIVRIDGRTFTCEVANELLLSEVELGTQFQAEVVHVLKILRSDELQE